MSTSLESREVLANKEEECVRYPPHNFACSTKRQQGLRIRSVTKAAALRARLPRVPGVRAHRQAWTREGWCLNEASMESI